MNLKDKTICKICGKNFKCLNSLRTHFQIHNLSSKQYYDQFFKKDNEGKCLECGKETDFKDINFGYRKFCSSKCNNSSKLTQEKAKQIFLMKYGVENPAQCEKFKKKIQKTCLEKYGVISTNKLHEVKEKKKQTCLKLYGTENPNQNIEILKKGQKSAFKIKSIEIKGKKFDIQGYEEIFLNLCQKGIISEFQIEDLTSDVPSTKYIFDSKEKIYIPDFYHSLSNTVIEVKSTWTFNGCGKDLRKLEEIKAKCKGVIITGYNFCLYILDKKGNVLRKITTLEEFKLFFLKFPVFG